MCEARWVDTAGRVVASVGRPGNVVADDLIACAFVRRGGACERSEDQAEEKGGERKRGPIDGRREELGERAAAFHQDIFVWRASSTIAIAQAELRSSP